MSERLSSQVILSISRRTEEANYCLWESQRSDQVIVMFCPHWAVWPQLHIAIGDKTDSDRLRRISKFGGKTDWDLFCGSPVIGAPVLLKRLTYNCQTTITVQQRWGWRCWKIKHCQRNSGTKALSTSTHSTLLVQSRSFNKHWNLGQISAWFCLAKGEKYK